MIDILGRRMKLSYLDHNEDFAKVLPVTGIATSRHATADVDDWYRVDLDKPVEFENQMFPYFLIRNRWSDDDFSDEGGTSVFVLLDPKNALSAERLIDISSYHHVAWGIAETID